MRSVCLVVLAVTVVAGASANHRALAMTAADQIGQRKVVQLVVNVCGVRGCVPVQTKRVIHHQKPGNKTPQHI